MSKLIGIYASGSPDIGMGHLFRMLGLTNHVAKDRLLFFFDNKFEESFIRSHGLNGYPIGELINFDLNILIVDSKLNEINQIIPDSSIQKKICVDSNLAWAKNFNTFIYPSFFYDKNLIQSLRMKKKEVFFGKEFTNIRYSLNNGIFSDILVTFGGSDPNDLTTMLLNEFKNSKIIGRKKILVIIGKMFKKNLKHFVSEYPGVSFIMNVPETADFINKTKIVFTSLGTTLQECEFFQRDTNIICNHNSDIKDFELISMHSSDKELWNFLGHHTEVNGMSINKAAQKNIKQKKKNDKKNIWGKGWASLLSQ